MAQFINNTESIRVDQFLMQTTQISRSKIAKAIDDGFVKVRGKPCTKSSAKLYCNDEVEISDAFFEPTQKPKSQHTPTIVYSDDDIIVVNKPSGLVVHDGDGVKETTLVDALREAGCELSSICGEGRDGIVHRLDAGTSGVMVVAKSDAAAEKLKESIINKETSKLYIAVIEKSLKEDSMVDWPIGRNPNNRVAMKVGKDGKQAKTLFIKLCQSKNQKYELLLAKIFTGRTHQIRAHLKHLGLHIVGDTLYGFKSQNDKLTNVRVLLHSYILDITHPINDQKTRFLAELPDDFKDFLYSEFLKETVDEVINETFIFDRLSTSDWRVFKQ